MGLGVGVGVGCCVDTGVGVSSSTVGLACTATRPVVAVGVCLPIPLAADAAIIHTKNNRRMAMIAPHPRPNFVLRVRVRNHCLKPGRLCRGAWYAGGYLNSPIVVCP